MANKMKTTEEITQSRDMTPEDRLELVRENMPLINKIMSNEGVSESEAGRLFFERREEGITNVAEGASRFLGAQGITEGVQPLPGQGVGVSDIGFERRQAALAGKEVSKEIDLGEKGFALGLQPKGTQAKEDAYTKAMGEYHAQQQMVQEQTKKAQRESEQAKQDVKAYGTEARVPDVTPADASFKRHVQFLKASANTDLILETKNRTAPPSQRYIKQTKNGQTSYKLVPIKNLDSDAKRVAAGLPSAYASPSRPPMLNMLGGKTSEKLSPIESSELSKWKAAFNVKLATTTIDTVADLEAVITGSENYNPIFVGAATQHAELEFMKKNITSFNELHREQVANKATDSEIAAWYDLKYPDKAKELSVGEKGKLVKRDKELKKQYDNENGKYFKDVWNENEQVSEIRARTATSARPELMSSSSFSKGVLNITDEKGVSYDAKVQKNNIEIAGAVALSKTNETAGQKALNDAKVEQQLLIEEMSVWQGVIGRIAKNEGTAQQQINDATELIQAGMDMKTVVDSIRQSFNTDPDIVAAYLAANPDSGVGGEKLWKDASREVGGKEATAGTIVLSGVDDNAIITDAISRMTEASGKGEIMNLDTALAEAVKAIPADNLLVSDDERGAGYMISLYAKTYDRLTTLKDDAGARKDEDQASRISAGVERIVEKEDSIMSNLRQDTEKMHERIAAKVEVNDAVFMSTYDGIRDGISDGILDQTEWAAAAFIMALGEDTMPIVKTIVSGGLKDAPQERQLQNIFDAMGTAMMGQEAAKVAEKVAESKKLSDVAEEKKLITDFNIKTNKLLTVFTPDPRKVEVAAVFANNARGVAARDAHLADPDENSRKQRLANERRILAKTSEVDDKADRTINIIKAGFLPSWTSMMVKDDVTGEYLVRWAAKNELAQTEEAWDNYEPRIATDFLDYPERYNEVMDAFQTSKKEWKKEELARILGYRLENLSPANKRLVDRLADDDIAQRHFIPAWSSYIGSEEQALWKDLLGGLPEGKKSALEKEGFPLKVAVEEPEQFLDEIEVQKEEARKAEEAPQKSGHVLMKSPDGTETFWSKESEVEKYTKRNATVVK